jgi:hypothetical protein
MSKTTIRPGTILSILHGHEPIDFSHAVEILREVEERPDLYLTTGSACAAYEVIKDWVEGGYANE